MKTSTIKPKFAMELLDRLGRVGQFFWSGWSGIAAICLFAALWQLGFEHYGAFILPAPITVAMAGVDLAFQQESWQIILSTAGRAFIAFIVATAVGMCFGALAGYMPAFQRLTRPFLTIILGVPPIAWIVLAMIWFGGSDGTVILTVIVAAAPIVFAGGVEGIATRDRGLEDMAKSFGAGPIGRFWYVGLRELLKHLFPAIILALATSFKVAIMAELLANAGGIGGALADARANFDIEYALAWIVLGVSILICVEYLLVHPFRAELERFKVAAQPWGVKR